MNNTADVVVVGAGIVGAACGEVLSGEGLRVAIVESEVVGGGATAAGMGHIVVMDEPEADYALTRYSRDLWDEFEPLLPPEVEFCRCGTLWVAADEEEMQIARRKAASYTRLGVRAELFDPAVLREAEPNLRPLAGGLLVPDDSIIYPPCAARWFVARAISRGALLHVGARVIELRNGEVLLASGGRISTGVTVCANGTWASSLVPSLDVRPRKGHLAITDRYPGFAHHEVVELGYLKSVHVPAAESVACNVLPRPNGQVLIGSSRQFGVTDARIDAPVLERMLRRAVEYFPGLARLNVIRTWTGFRAATSDRLPLIGRCPGYDKIYLATGHEGLGITTATGTARLIADLILGHEPAIPTGPYAPSRPTLGSAHA